MNISRTFAMIKPGAVQRGLMGEIIKRMEYKGLTIVSMKLIVVSEGQAKAHYKIHKDKPFYNDLVNYIMSGPVVVLAIEGHNVVDLVRHMAGSTNPLESASGTIRGDFSSSIENNIIHTSDSIENARYELSIYFNDNEILDYDKATDQWAFGGE